MKKSVLTAALFLAIGIAARAQAPQQFNYQGVARSTTGAPLTTAPIGIQIIIHDGSPTGTVIYQETQHPTTNSFGLYSLAVGGGTVVSGTFSSIAWGSGDKYMEVDIDPTGGTTYGFAGTSQLLSVPYAVYANNANTASTATSATTLTGTVTMGGDVTGTNAAATVVKLQGNAMSATAPASGQVLTWNSGSSSWMPATPSVGTTYTAGTGVNIVGPVISAENTTALWNANSLEGNSVSASAPTSGQVLTWNSGSSTWAPATPSVGTTYTAGTGVTIIGSAISAENTTALWNANSLEGNSVSASAPASGQVLTWNSGTSSWAPATPAAPPVYTGGTGISITGTTVGALNATALWNANSLQGNSVSATAPTSGQFMEYTGSAWAPTSVTIPTLTGTTNYLPIFTSATALGNSIIYENPGAGNRIGINYGTTNHGLVAIKATTDTEALYINQSGTPGTGGYGIVRLEYSGTVDNTRVGVLSTTIRSVGDVNGTGVEGAGNYIGVQGYGENSLTTSGSQVEGTEGDSYGSGTYSVAIAGFGSNYSGAPTNCYGVYGYAAGGTTNYAMYSDGNMRINGSISKASGTFEIDDPLDPANKYLYHSFVESPDMMNIYNGNVTTDADGNATVTLPDYFDALNKDFRYQLTTVGSFAQVMISEKVKGNKFSIKTSVPNVEVSWQVTGVRQDAWANAHRVVTEVEKAPHDKGKYLHPKEMGLSEDLRIGGDFKSHAKKDDPAMRSSQQGTKQ